MQVLQSQAAVELVFLNGYCRLLESFLSRDLLMAEQCDLVRLVGVCCMLIVEEAVVIMPVLCPQEVALSEANEWWRGIGSVTRTGFSWRQLDQLR